MKPPIVGGNSRPLQPVPPKAAPGFDKVLAGELERRGVEMERPRELDPQPMDSPPPLPPPPPPPPPQNDEPIDP